MFTFLWIRRAAQLVGTTVLVCASAPVLAAAAQEQMTPCELFGTQPASFVGEIGEPIRHWLKAAPDVQPIQILALPVTVERSFRGVAVNSVVYLYPIEAAMVVAPAAGRRYLVYGAFNFGKLKDVVMPVAMKPIEEAADDLAFLEVAGASATTGSIHGVLAQGNRFNTDQRTPLPGVTIRFRSGETNLEVVSDDSGRYAVSGLPEGLVSIDPLLPDHLVAKWGAQITAGGCTPQYLLAELNGRIRGRVILPDQSPMTWMVDVLPVDPRREDIERRGRDVRADKNGEYEFSALPPGEYLVGVNLIGPPGSGTPFPLTYYPGTRHREEATAIAVGRGTIHEAIDFTLHDPIKAGKLEVRIEDAGGAATIAVCFKDVTSSFAAPGGTYRQREPGSPIAIDVLAGSRYRFVAHVERQDGHSESDVVELTAEPGHQTMIVRANRRARNHLPGDECGLFFDSRP